MRDSRGGLGPARCRLWTAKADRVGFVSGDRHSALDRERIAIASLGAKPSPLAGR